MHRLVCLLLAACVLVAEDAVVEAPSAEATSPVAGWTTTGRLGAFLTQTTAVNQETSRDSSIGGSLDAIAWRLNGDLAADYRAAPYSSDQRLRFRYGRIRQEDQPWSENSDEIRYDGTYRYAINPPHHLYGNTGIETVFTGPAPESRWFDPTLGRASAGYSLLFENLLPLTDQLEARLGVRLQRRWGHTVTSTQEDWEVGGEVFLRYERQQREDLRYFVQYEAFNEFDDLEHIVHLAQAGASLRVTRLLSVDLALRGYYEHAPEDAAPGDTGFDEVSWRQELLIGLVVEY